MQNLTIIINQDGKKTGGGRKLARALSEALGAIGERPSLHPPSSAKEGESTGKVGTGTLQIIKTTQHNNGAVGGFEFEVRNAAGVLVGTYTSSNLGRVDIPNLNAGTYSVKEVNLSNEFVAPKQNPIEVEVKAGQTATISFENIKKRGVITVQKTDANPTLGGYSLAGAIFEVRNSSGTLVDTITTGSNGRAQTVLLPLGSYTIKEKTAPYGFVIDTKTYTATLSGAQGTAEVVYCPDVTIAEQPQVGRINLTKTNRNPNMGDYSLAGAVFEIRNSAGTLVDTVTTDAQGKAQSKDLKLGSFTVTEKTAPYGYVRNTNTFNATLNYAGQDVSIVYSSVTVPEDPQVGTITITKLDKSTGTRAQGDSTLNGAVFEIYAAQDIKKLDGSFIYRKDQLVDTLYCGSNSSATSKELPLGNFYYKEKTPPVGYTPDTASYPIAIEYAGQNVAVTKVYGDLKNKVVEGQIALVKHTDLPDPNVDPPNPQVEMPLEGIRFEVFLKSAGSYGNARATERDLLVTNENGYAESSKLPYGIYTVKELPDEQGRDVKLVAPFDVFISTDGRVYRYILNNPLFTSLVKIVKVDAETGKTIPAAGVSFKVKDLSTGKWVSQSFNYPVPTTIDVFETAPDGTLVMPEALKSGNYELHEQKAPYGYVLTATPVKFTIHSTQENPEILEVVMKNAPAKGIIKVEKTGNMLTDTIVTDTAFGEQLTPVFSLTGLKGAVFNVIAAEDIITPDGTLRYAKGEVVDTITTNKKGYAESIKLYLGNYVLLETEAPFGFALDEIPHSVSLVYECQEVPVVSSQIGIGNVRQTVEIELQKLMEKPVNAPEGFNPYADVVFGLFADEDIKSVTGEVVIAKDSLIALMQIDSEGKGIVSGELPFAKFYMQELQTNIFYQLNDTKYPVVAEYAGQDVTTSKVQVNNGGIALPNELKLGRITIEKTGEMLVGANQKVGKSDVMYTPIYEARKLSGVVFDVVAAEDIHDVYGRLITAKGTVVDTVTTGADGIATTKLLHLGNYELIEKIVPFGFVSDGKPIAVTLDLDAQLVEDYLEKSVSIFNERQKAAVTLDKVMEMPENPPEGFNPYADVQFSLFAKEDIKAADGEVVIPAGALLEIFGVDNNGKGKIKTDLPFGNFIIRETKTAEGYKLLDTAYDLTFDYNAEAVAVIELAVNNGEPIVNDLMRGSLKIIKTFENKSTPIEGVSFTITGTTVIGTAVEINAVTDTNSEILIENLLVGEYKIKELSSDLTVGYVLSDEENAVVAADEIAEMTIHNKLIRGDIRVLKTDAETGEPLAGAVFGLYLNGELLEKQTTNRDGVAVFLNIAYGDYEIRVRP